MGRPPLILAVLLALLASGCLTRLAIERTLLEEVRPLPVLRQVVRAWHDLPRSALRVEVRCADGDFVTCLVPLDAAGGTILEEGAVSAPPTGWVPVAVVEQFPSAALRATQPPWSLWIQQAVTSGHELRIVGPSPDQPWELPLPVRVRHRSWLERVVTAVALTPLALVGDVVLWLPFASLTGDLDPFGDWDDEGEDEYYTQPDPPSRFDGRRAIPEAP